MILPKSIQSAIQKLHGYTKENLDEILYDLSQAIPLLTQRSHSRLYLEDLTGGILHCAMISGHKA
ncbi:MAG: hypothetical protein OET90_08160, partial [Desulfuromonadales bacterium]|nr:hypothetical protein [Desulfuromonadales bacterium]